MAAYDSPSQGLPGIGQNDLFSSVGEQYSSYLDRISGYAAYQGRPPVNYATPESGVAPGLPRSRDILQLDPDPFGAFTSRYAESIPGSGVTGDTSLALDVFGKRMTREELLRSDAGRRLLQITEDAKKGRRRDFWDAIKEWSWSDAPFLSLFATVGGSVADAVMVSDTYRKLQNGEPVTDEELIKTRLHMAETERRQDGTWGATVGDIMRAAPGFMVEFMLSGGLYSAVRTGLAKAAGKGSSLLLTGATKKAAREVVETGMRRVAMQAGEAGADAATGTLRLFEGIRTMAKDPTRMAKFADDATDTVMEALRGGKMGLNPYLTELGKDGSVKFVDETLARQTVRNRVLHEMDKMVARNSSESAVVRGMHQFGQWFQRHASSALLDHGVWGTEEATVLTTGFTKARSALADAAGALFIEAPIRGSMLMAPNQFLARPLLGMALGKDGRTVSEAELGVRQSAYLTNSKEVMDDADAIANGMNWLEYVSESAGRGFGSLARGVGLWINRGVRSPVAKGAGATLAKAADDAAYDGFSVGGALRKMWLKSFGTRADSVRKSVDAQARVVGDTIRAAGHRVDDASVRSMIVTNSAERMPEAVRQMVGDSVEAFTRSAMKSADRKTMEELGYRTFGRYMVADWMVRHNVGPETVVNMFQRMGYDGVLGEMLEERYSDVAKGMMGWNDKTDRKEIGRRVTEAIKGLWPGWEQLTAEAVGFAMPMVTRMGVARIQAKLGGEGPLQELRNRIEMFSDMFRSPVTLRARLGEFLDVRRMTDEGLTARLDDVNRRLAEARDAGDAEAVRSLEDEAAHVARTKDRYAKASAGWFAGMREAAKTGYDARIAEARRSGDEAGAARLEAERDAADRAYAQWEEGKDYSTGAAAQDIVDQLVVIEPLTRDVAETEGVEYSMRPVRTSDQSAKGMDAAEAFVDFSPRLAKMLFQLDAPMEGEAPSGLRAVAGRLIGMAGAVVTGDFSLVSRDPATWVARDMGLGRGFVQGLKQGFASARKEAREQLRREAREGKVENYAKNFSDVQDFKAEEGVNHPTADNFREGSRRLDTAIVTEEAVDAKAEELFAERARALAMNYLATQQIRTFSRGEMRDRALVLAARGLSQEDGGPYDVVDTEHRQFAKLTGDGKRIDESTRIGFDEFYERFGRDATGADGKRTRKGVDTLTQEIAVAAMDILTNRSSGVEIAGRRIPAVVVQLPENADFEQTAIYNAAMQMTGMRGTVTTQRLRSDRTLDQQMQEGAIAHVPAPVLAAIAAQAAKPDGTWDPSQVEEGLLETVAYSFGFRFDGTEKGLNERNRKIVGIAALADAAKDPDTAWFRLYDDARTEDRRNKDGAFVLVKAERRDDGRWHCRTDEKGDEVSSDTLDGMLGILKGKAANAQRVDGRIVFTQQRVLESDSLVDMLRITGLTDSYIEQTKGNPHPLFAQDADGNWLRSEEDAERELERLVELASRTDGDHLVRPSRPEMTGDEFRKEEAAANAAWQALYGEDTGFVTVGERLLRSAGVSTTGTLGLVSGRRRAAGAYQVRLTDFMGRDGNMYVPVDLTREIDYREALANVRIMRAYALNPRAVRDAFGKGCSEFIDELDRLCLVKARDAANRGDKPLESDLMDLRKGIFAATSRVELVRNDDGTVDVNDRVAGMNPHVFAQLGHMLCLFGAERLKNDGYGRIPRVAAYAAIAEDARSLPHYPAFMSCVDVALGGSGFLGELLTPQGETRDDSRGLGGLARTYLNDSKSYGELFARSAPAGVDVNVLLDQCNRELMSMGRPALKFHQTGDRSRRQPRSYGEFGDLMDQLAKDTGLKGADLAAFISRAVSTAVRLEGAERTDIAKAVDEVTKGGRSLAQYVESFNSAVRKTTELTAQKNDLTVKLNRHHELASALESKRERVGLSKSEQAQLDALHAVIDGGRFALDKVLKEIAQAEAVREDASRKLNDEAKSQGVSVSGRRRLGGRRLKGGDATEADSSSYPSVSTETSGLPVFENVLYTGATTLAQGVRLADDGLLLGTYLTGRESRAAFSVVLRALLAEDPDANVTAERFSGMMHRMFPMLPAYDRAQIMAVLTDTLAGVESTAKPWSEIADEGFDFTYIEEDKDENEGADTSSENQAIARRAVDELSNEALRTFLKLARFVAPASAGNLQAFLGSLRETVRQSAGAEGLHGFLRTLLEPRALTEHNGVRLTSYNQREAVFHDIVDRVIEGDSFDGYVRESFEMSPRIGFLLSYLRAMAPADRARFAQLIGNAAACDPVRRVDRSKEGNPPTMGSAATHSTRVTAAVAAATFGRFIGGASSRAYQAGNSLAQSAKGTELVGDPKKRQSDPGDDLKVCLGVIDANRKAVADILARSVDEKGNPFEILGDDAPVVLALRSDAMMAYLRRVCGEEEEERKRRARRGEKYHGAMSGLVRPLAEALSRRDGSVSLVDSVVDGLKLLGRGLKSDHTVTYEEAEAFSVALFATGESTRNLATLPDKSSRVDRPIATLMSIYAASQPQTIMRADVDARRSSDESSVAITSRGVIPILSRWMDSEAGFIKLVKQFFAGDVDTPEKLERVLARCRQDMVWPDGTRILAKSISAAYHADEIYEACRRQFVEAGENDTYLVPVYAGDHASSVLIQLPRKVLPRFVADARKTFARAAVRGERKGREFKGETMKAARDRIYPKLYEYAARFVSDSIGLDLLGDDTKRSALSSLEQAGLSMTGVRERDGKPEFGHCTVHITCNYRSRREARIAKDGANGNEELKGNVILAGYGAYRQRQCAKLRGTGTLKCHLMSSGGRDLLFLKALCISPEDARGKFLDGDCKQALLKHAMKGIDQSIDTAVLTDLDSYKVGPAMSKWITVNGGRNILDFVVETIEQDKDLWKDGKLAIPDGFDADAYFEGKVTFDAQRRSDGAKPPAKLSDLLPGLKLSVVEGLRGDTVDISYVDDNLTSYNVANVSHGARPGSMRTPRNNVVDAITMSVVEAQLRGDDSAAAGLLDLVADWGLAATAICGADDIVASLAASSPGLRGLVEAGEAPNGALMKEELFRTAWAAMRKQLSIPMEGTDMPLVSAGAGVTVLRDRAGRIRYDDSTGLPLFSNLSDSEMMHDINLGSVLFTEEETRRGGAYEGFSRRLALSAVNVNDRGFRYGWWMDEAAFDGEFFGAGGQTALEDRFDETFGVQRPQVPAKITDRMRLDMLESQFTQLRDAEQRGDDTMAAQIRDRLATCFTDHHGMKISDYGKDIGQIGFEDLFVDDGRGGRRFDRSAVQIDDDKVHNLKGERHVFLGGTAFGIPRTPSYNGGQWLQVVRASVPVTEREHPRQKGRFIPGEDAMVAPDPVTNEILGCDHDGDKTKVYWLVPDGGRVSLLEDGRIPLGDVNPKFFASAGELGAEARGQVYAKLRDAGFVEETVDPKTGAVERKISTDARKAVGNTFVRHLFDMAHRLPVPERDGHRRQSFLDGPVSMPTTAFPGSDALRKELLGMTESARRPGARKTLRNGHRLNEPGLAALVSAQANDAADARGKIVAYARALHLAYMSGRYANGAGTLFGNRFTPDRWLRFMHIVDGISNATFDDIKEQLCSRLGWTNGMMPVLVADLLRGDAGAPVTGELALRYTLVRYVNSVNNYGSRYYMMVAADETDREGFQSALDALFGERRKGDPNRWALAFGLRQGKDGWETAKTAGELKANPTKPSEAVVALVQDAVDRLNEGRALENRLSYSDAYGFLAYSGRRSDAAPGGLFHLLKVAGGVKADSPAKIAEALKGRKITKAEFDARTPELLEALVDYLSYSEKRKQLEDAREGGNAFNYLAADPGNTSAGDRLAKAVKSGLPLLDNAGALVKHSEGELWFNERTRALARMHAATLAAYRIGGGVETVLARANAAVAVHEDLKSSISDLTVPGDESLEAVNRALLDLAPMSDASYDRMERESAAQTKLFLLAALQSVPGKSPKEVLDTLRKIAEAQARPGVDTDPDGAVFRMMRGVATLFDVMYRLVSTSTEHYAPTDAAGRRRGAPMSAFAYFSERRDGRYPASEARSGAKGPYSVARYPDGDTSANPLYVIQPRFQGDEGPAAALAREAVAAIVSDDAKKRAFSGRRERINGNTSAASFDLTEANLRAFMQEYGGDGARELNAEVEEAIRIVKAIGPVSPYRMFREILPVYTAIVHRTTGEATVGGRSLAPLLGVHGEWSRHQVANDNACRPLVDVYLGAETAPVDKAAPPVLDENGDPRYGGAGRSNPEHRSVVDVFAGDGFVADVAGRLNVGGIREEAARNAPSPKLPEGVTPSEVAKRHAQALQALAGSWATVRYTGENSFVLEGSLRGGVTGGAPKTQRIAICVSIGDDGLMSVETDEQVSMFASSRAYAASFAGTDAAKAMGVTSADAFLALPEDVRKSIVKRFSVGAASANRPVFTVTGKGMRVLTGAIRIAGSKQETQLYHEYFHSMMAMFRGLGLFSVADIRALQDTFGKPPPGSGMLFDEERAAERYRQWVEKGTETRETKAVEGVFRKIFNAIAALLRSIVDGFSYRRGETAAEGKFTRNEELLFSFVTAGVAARSNERIAELERVAVMDGERLDVRGQIDRGVKPEGVGLADVELGTAADIATRLRWDNPSDLVVERTADGVWVPRELTDDDYGEDGGLKEGIRPATHREAIDFMTKRIQLSAEELGVAPHPDPEVGPLVKGRYDRLKAKAVELLSAEGALDAEALSSVLGELAKMGGSLEAGFTDLARAYNEGSPQLDQVAETNLAVTVGVPPVGSETFPFYGAGRTLAEICTGKLKESLPYDTEMLKSKLFGGDVKRLASRLTESAKGVIVAGFRDALSVLNPEALGKFSPDRFQDRLAFELLLCAAQTLDRMVVTDSAGAKERAFLRAEGEAPERKWHASAYDVSSWILASGGVDPVSIVADTVKSLNALEHINDPDVEPLAVTCRGVLDRLQETLSDPSSYIGELTKATQAIDGLIKGFAPGVKFSGRDVDGSIMDYVLADRGTSDNQATDENLKVYGAIDAANAGLPSYRAAQDALKLTFGALYRAMAMVKFHRELGFVPPSKADLDFERRIREQNRIAAAQSPAEWFATHAIGESNLLDNEGLVEFYDQPFFVADNMDAYLASTIRPRFGTTEFGDAVRADGHEYAGLMYEIKDLDNWQAWALGDAMLPGNELLLPVLRGGRFAVDSGSVKFLGGKGRLVGFDAYNRVTCGISLTEDEVRDVDWFKKALAFKMGGWNDVITGLDRITFRQNDALLPAKWSDLLGSCDRKFFGGKEYMSRFEMTVHRMPHQLHGNLLGGQMNFGEEFASAAHAALKRVADEYSELCRKADAATLSHDERIRYESFDFNAEVIEELESKGLVVARRRKDGRAYECVVRLGTDRILEWFKGTEAYRKITSPERWAKTGLSQAEVEAMFTPEALIAPMRDRWNRLSRFVREHPWMTQGDAKHLTAFGTPLPFFQGTGVFMYNAVRAARAENRRTHVDSLGDMESRWFAAVTSLANGRRIGDAPAGTEAQLRAAKGEEHTTLSVFRDLIGAKDLELVELKRALIAGDFRPGGKYADRTARYGIDLPPNPTLAAIHDETYRLMVERAELEATGDTARDVPIDLQACIDRFQEHRAASGLTGGLGCSPAAMYRAYGTLPANHQLGHMVRKAAEGVTNAMAHRGTFMSLMTTPAPDGSPVYYMRPADDAAATSGIPDQCWEQIARWWAAYHGLRYDPGKSGVQNAQAIYDRLGEIGDKGGRTGHWRIPLGVGDHRHHRYVPLDGDRGELASVTGIMCMEDENLGEDSSAINALAKGEAVGYMRQFVDSGRAQSFLAVRKNIHRALSWSKSMSVAFSLFFPLATRFESPIGAIGAIPTLMGNVKGGPDFVREHPEIFNFLQGHVFKGKGWITKDFIGFRDYRDMMDSRDPFLAEMVSWVHALGLSYSDDLVNPMEHSKAIVANDIKSLESLMRKAGWAPGVVRRFRNFADAVLIRPGDKAFRYALNATKLAVVSQLAMKLRHEAQVRGKAFDPIRDLRKYASYVNAEVGGIDERRYAWAHPAMRNILNCLFFSWQWTRGAWEAGGGNVIEDFVFGGHSATREERKYILGRWARMYGEIMIGVPLLMQMASMAFAKCLGGGDDDDDRWFTWQNEGKANLSAFDITPLMKAVHRHEDVAGIAGRIGGALVGMRRFGWLGAAGGALLGDRLVPDYRGEDAANQKTKARRYYMHFGKQGWEFFRWFDRPGQQFAGKLSMPAQRLIEGFLGRNLTYMDHGLAWDDMGPVERWLNPSLDSASVNLLKAFLPFSAGQMMSFGDAGFLPIVGPVQMGASQTAVQKRLERAVEAWARNDRAAYSWGVDRNPSRGKKKARMLAGRFPDILEDARRNGLDPEAQLNTALGTVASKLYGRLFSLLPEKADGDYDVKAVERVCRQLNRVLSRKADVLQSVKKKLDDRKGATWKDLPLEMRRRYRDVIAREMGDPFGGEPSMPIKAPEREEY